MPDSPYLKKLALGEPATYKIEVKGSLDGDWSGRLAGMHIEKRHQEDRETVTILSGKVRDQAELIGVLNNLYELHMPLLSVEILDNK